MLVSFEYSDTAGYTVLVSLEYSDTAGCSVLVSLEYSDNAGCSVLVSLEYSDTAGCSVEGSAVPMNCAVDSKSLLMNVLCCAAPTAHGPIILKAWSHTHAYMENHIHTHMNDSKRT